MTSMPADFMSFSSAANSPDWILARCGYVWLPIGSPSGFARSAGTFAARKPATATSVAVFLKNSLLVIAAIKISSRVLLAGAGFVEPDVGDGPVRGVFHGVGLRDAHELRTDRRERDGGARPGPLPFGDGLSPVGSVLRDFDAIAARIRERRRCRRCSTSASPAGAAAAARRRAR